MSTAIVFTKQNSVVSRPASTGAAQYGYQLTYTVTHANLIDLNVFVYQNTLSTQGSSSLDNYFYSVASVADMALVLADTPAEGSSFYRTNTVSLVYGCMDDLEAGAESIEAMIFNLCEANDVFLTSVESNTLSYPLSSANLYWFTSLSDTPADDSILGSLHEACPNLNFNLNFDIGSTPQYLVVCLPADLGTPSFTLNGVAISMNITNRNFTDAAGLVLSYNICVSPTAMTGTGLSLVCAPASLSPSST